MSSMKWRGRQQLEEAQTSCAATTPSSMRTISSMDCLKPGEICIEGNVYNLETFQHPGGDVIQLFGGTDATVLYKMIHMHHHADHHLKKNMQLVGRVQNYKSEYTFDSEFAKDLKHQVSKIVPRGKEFATLGFYVRAMIYIALSILLTAHWVIYGPSFVQAVVYGISQAFIGLNIQHDANHGAISRNLWINDWLGYAADLIGGNKQEWTKKHWTHHAYCNDPSKDPDVVAAEPLMIFLDYPVGHSSRKWYHSFQTLLFLPICSAYWLSSIAASLMDRPKLENDFEKQQVPISAFLRAVYLLIIFGSPLYHHGGVTLCGISQVLTVGVAGSLVLAFLFVLSHNFDGAERDPTGQHVHSSSTKVDDDPKPVCWFKSQVETSCSYGGFVSGYLTGGLNFQVEHHLFPRMNSAWYPIIAPTVREVCKKHDIRYTYFPWIWMNATSMIKYLHVVGHGANNHNSTTAKVPPTVVEK